MKKAIWLLFLLIPLIVIWAMVYNNNANEILINPVVSPTPTAVLSEAPVATPSPQIAIIKVESESVKPKKITPTAKPTPTMTSSEEVYKLIEKYASAKGIDPNVVRYIALCESGFRSNAVNGKYVGLFQFAAVSWSNLRLEMGKDPNADLRFSAEDSIETLVYALSKGKEKMWPNCIPK